MIRTVMIGGLVALLAACAGQGAQAPAPTAASAAALPPGSHERLRAALSHAPGIEVIVSEVIIPPGAGVAAHYHPGEEFLMVIEGSAVHVEAGKPAQILKAGDVYAIPAQAVHAPRGGPEGARAVVFRVHTAGQPERILVDAAPPSSEESTSR